MARDNAYGSRPAELCLGSRSHAGSKPNFLWSSLSGADAPNVFMPITDLLLTERLAVGCRRVLFMRCTVANVAVQHDERGTILRLAKNVEGVLDARDVVSIADTHNVPAVGQKPRCHVLGKGE